MDQAGMIISVAEIWAESRAALALSERLAKDANEARERGDEQAKIDLAVAAAVEVGRSRGLREALEIMNNNK